MGCPCSAKTHPRQSGANAPANPAPADRRIGATRGDRWTGPARPPVAAPRRTPPAAE